MSVRVVRDAGVVRPLELPPRPVVARIPAEIAAAREAAAAIVADAEAQADEVRARARSEGLAAGRADAAALLIAIRADEAARATRLSGLVSMAAFAVAERLLGGALRSDDATLEAWARQSLSVFGRARRLVVRANPATSARLADRLSSIAPSKDLALELLPDPAIALEELVVQADTGDARVELTAQIESLLLSLAPLLDAELAAHEAGRG